MPTNKLCQLICVHMTRRAVSRVIEVYTLPIPPQMIIDLNGHNRL
jgi:hypothetical protein